MLCVHVAMLHPGHTSIMPLRQPPHVQALALRLHLSHATHTHTLPAHSHIHTRTSAQPRHPSTHHPQTSPLSLFQGAHGKPPESAGLRRTWAWPNSFPWLWTWDHPLLIFLFILSLCCLCFYFPHSIDLSWPLHHLCVYLFFSPPQLFSSSPSSLSFDYCCRDWHLKAIRLLSKDSYSHAPHLIRRRQMHNSMMTLRQNDNNKALISAHKLQKLWNKQWMPVLSTALWLGDDDERQLSIVIPSSPHSLSCDLMCVWPNCECAREWDWTKEKLKVREKDCQTVWWIKPLLSPLFSFTPPDS